MSTDQNYPASLRDIDEIHASARLLVEYAARRDVIVTIDLVPMQPLAMGNYAAAIKVWPRKVSAVVQALGASAETWGFEPVGDRPAPWSGPPDDEGIGHFSIPSGLHPATADLVQSFAAALAVKLRQAERKHGYSDGWMDPGWMDRCRADLLLHLDKGDPRDVAAYCAFLWHHGQTTEAPAPAPAASQLVPGVVHCARCKFRLHRTNLYVNSGTTGPGDNSTEPCPNGCGPLWPVTWEQEAREAYKTAEDMFNRWKAAEAAAAAAEPAGKGH